MRFVMEALAGLAGGVVGWLVVGFSAGWIMSSIWGHREGAQAMAGFFVIGPAGGLAGFALAFWLAHRVLGRGEGADASPHVVVLGLVALAVILGVAWAAIQVVVAIRRPDAPEDLADGEKGAIEFEVGVPEKVLGGKPASEVISLAYQVTDEQRESLRPVAWKEEVGGGRVKLTGRIPIERRTRGQYLVVRQGAEEYSLWARMPANMHKSGSWEERVYLGRDPALTMEERVSVTSRYVPPGR